jgi:hypothetical protein
MFKNGTLVTLAIDKTHGEGESALKLKEGTCGLVMKAEKQLDGNNLYVVEFGAFGQWYCRHSELLGDDNEGWDEELPPVRVSIGTTPSAIYSATDFNEDEEDEQEAGTTETEEAKTEFVSTGNVEEDIAKRMEQLQKEQGLIS